MYLAKSVPLAGLENDSEDESCSLRVGSRCLAWVGRALEVPIYAVVYGQGALEMKLLCGYYGAFPEALELVDVVDDWPAAAAAAAAVVANEGGATTNAGLAVGAATVAAHARFARVAAIDHDPAGVDSCGPPLDCQC